MSIKELEKVEILEPSSKIEYLLELVSQKNISLALVEKHDKQIDDVKETLRDLSYQIKYIAKDTENFKGLAKEINAIAKNLTISARESSEVSNKLSELSEKTEKLEICLNQHAEVIKELKAKKRQLKKLISFTLKYWKKISIIGGFIITVVNYLKAHIK